MSWWRLLTGWRERPMRTAITGMGVGIAVAAFFAHLAFTRNYQQGIQSELNHLGAHVLLVPKGCPYDAASMALHGANWSCYLEEGYLEEVTHVEGVAAASPVLMTASRDRQAAPVVYLGVHSNLVALKPGWKIAGKFPSAQNGLLVGAELQMRHGWKLGEHVELPGLPGKSGIIEGVLSHTYTSEDTFIYMRLADTQREFRHTNKLTHILIRLADPNELDQVVGRLRGCDAGLQMNVIPLAHIFRTIQSVVSSTRFLLLSVAIVALFIAGSGVSNTVLMSVTERTREIGVMRAIGASRADIMRLVWAEAMQVCLAGATAGLIAAGLLAPWIERWARSRVPFAPTEPLVRWDWTLALASLAFAAILGTLASLLPAWWASKVPPAAAMRTKENPL